MLVTIAGTMTMASARDGGMVTASRPIATVGRPSPTTPLMKPASRNAAAMKMRRGSDMPATLTDRGQGHNLEVTEQAFGLDEGCCRHCEERSDEAIHTSFAVRWIASRSLSSRGALRRPVGSQ